jgi:hypothetical protein
MDERNTATGGGRSAQERHDLLGIEGPIEFSATIKTPQHRDTQAIVLDPIFVLRDIDQLHQQTVLDQGHQFFFGKFTQMATQGAEKLTFRRHDEQTRQSEVSF